MGPGAEYPARNAIGIVGAVPDIAKQVVKVRHMCAKMKEAQETLELLKQMDMLSSELPPAGGEP